MLPNQTIRLRSAIVRVALSMAFMIVMVLTARAQTINSQVWAEYMLNHPFANSWNVELAGTYSTLLESPRWRSFDLQVTPEYALTPRVDLMGALLYNRTVQYEALSSTEIRAMLGTRIHITPHSRIMTRLLLRVEQRNMFYQETGTEEQSLRGRIRLETVSAINRKTMYGGDRLWYLIADVEAFLPIDQQVNERFANRYRIRLGPGFRLNYTWRFEFLYTLQQSYNTLAGDFSTTDNLFRFRVKHYLNKAKPSRALGNGN